MTTNSINSRAGCSTSALIADSTACNTDELPYLLATALCDSCGSITQCLQTTSTRLIGFHSRYVRSKKCDQCLSDANFSVMEELREREKQ